MGHLVTLLSQNKIIVSDSFNRANNSTSLGVADTGQTWQYLLGTMGISGNQAYSTTASDSFGVIESFTPNCKVGATLSFFTASGGSRIIVRATDANNFILVQATSAAGYVVHRRQASAYTQLGAYATTPVSGDVVRVILTDSLIRVFVNGVERINVTSTFNATATLHGIGSTIANGPKYDNFFVEV